MPVLRRSALRPPSISVLLGIALLMVAGCDTGDPVTSGPPASADDPELGLTVSHGVAAVGDTVVVAVPDPGGSPLAGLQGTLSWDPRRFELVGQEAAPPAVTFVNPSEPGGSARFVAADPLGRQTDLVVLAFRDLAGGPVDGFALDVELGVKPDGTPVTPRARAAVELDRDLQRPGIVPVLDAEGWYALVEPDGPEGPARPERVPGASDRFGDGTEDGLVNVSDVVYTANVAVGNQEQAECIVGTDDPDRDCVAVNVRPSNLPGLGGPGDDCPPGLDACGTLLRVVNVVDLVVIANEAVGNDQDVVGEIIPKAPISGDTVDVAGILTGARTFSVDTIYRLNGIVTVGDEAGAGGDLLIEAGTRVLGNPGSALVVSRNGRIDAAGTAIRPIVFACATGFQPGCWHGLVVNGNGEVNTGAATSPEVTGRATAGCKEIAAAYGSFGGCAANDSSGVLKYLSLEDAGFNDGAGLVLRGVGDGTVVEQIYVSRSTVGVDFRGGLAQARYIRVMGPIAYGLRWSDGWRGKLQYVLLQAGSSTVASMLGTNNPGAPDALPRSNPTIRNATVIGPPDPALTGLAAGGVILQDGSGGTVTSAIFRAQPEVESHVLDIDGVASWAVFASGGIRLDSSVIAGFGRLGSVDPDEPVPGFVSPGIEDQYLRDAGPGNTIIDSFSPVDSVLRAPFATVPDVRFDPGDAVSGVTCSDSGPDPFFESVRFCGATDTRLLTLSDIPWMEPSLRLFDTSPTPTDPQPALLRYIVNSPERGPLLGVTLSGPTFGVSARDGIYRSYVPPDSGFVLTLGNIPDGCTAPVGTIVLLPLAPGEERTNGIDITCTP